MENLYKAHSADWSEDDGGSDDDGDAPIARVRRKFLNTAESIKASNRLLKTEAGGMEGKTFTWKPDPDSAWSQWEDVHTKRALRYFRQYSPGTYEIQEL